MANFEFSSGRLLGKRRLQIGNCHRAQTECEGLQKTSPLLYWVHGWLLDLPLHRAAPGLILVVVGLWSRGQTVVPATQRQSRVRLASSTRDHVLILGGF